MMQCPVCKADITVLSRPASIRSPSQANLRGSISAVQPPLSPTITTAQTERDIERALREDAAREEARYGVQRTRFADDDEPDSEEPTERTPLVARRESGASR